MHTYNIDERRVLWNCREKGNTEVSNLIGVAISRKYHGFLKDSHDGMH